MIVDDYRKEGFTKEEWIYGIIGTALMVAVLVMAS